MSPARVRRSLLAGVFGLALMPRRGWAREVGGVSLDDSVTLASGDRIRLAGAGVFRFLFLRYYVCGLYLPGEVRAQAALASDAPRRIAMVMLRNVSAREFLWGLDRGLADNTSAQELRALRESLDTLREAIRAIALLGRGARVALDYAPGQGTQLAVDGVPRAALLPGKTFNDALLRVWLGEHPLDAALKEMLLAG